MQTTEKERVSEKEAKFERKIHWQMKNCDVCLCDYLVGSCFSLCIFIRKAVSKLHINMMLVHLLMYDNQLIIIRW